MALNANAMADQMVAAMKAAWKTLKGEDFPGGDTTDAKVMFLAVADGLVAYLKANPAELVSAITLARPPTQVTAVSITHAVISVAVKAT